jgi:hypothetical protein
MAHSLYGLRSVGSRKAGKEESKIEEKKRKKHYTNILEDILKKLFRLNFKKTCEILCLFSYKRHIIFIIISVDGLPILQT